MKNLFSKKKPLNTDGIRMNIPGLPSEKGHAHIYEHIAGRPLKDPIYDVSGFKVDVEAVVVRTYKPDLYTLAVKLGEEWRPITKLSDDSPLVKAAIEGGHMVEYGYSPDAIKRQQEKEKEQLRAQENQNTYRTVRANAIRADMEKAAKARPARRATA